MCVLENKWFYVSVPYQNTLVMLSCTATCIGTCKVLVQNTWWIIISAPFTSLHDFIYTPQYLTTHTFVCANYLPFYTDCTVYFTTHTHTLTPYRVPQRQISLYKFISTCSDLLPAPLFPALMHMLVGLASSTHSAHHTFNYLKANSPSLGTKEGACTCVIQLQLCF